jgi:hypothetical protein
VFFAQQFGEGCEEKFNLDVQQGSPAAYSHYEMAEAPVLQDRGFCFFQRAFVVARVAIFADMKNGL